MVQHHPPATPHTPPGNSWGLCTPFMMQLPISGAVISVVDRAGHRAAVAATDPVAARWDELELELGTGPLTHATTSTSPQLVGDVREGALDSVIGSHFDSLGMRAVFAFPLIMGLATVGAVGLYRGTAGSLTSAHVGVALALAQSTAIRAVREALALAAPDGNTDPGGVGSGLRREVHQATGMLSAQLDISTSDAFARLRAYAISSERSITAISLDIVDGTIDGADLD